MMIQEVKGGTTMTATQAIANAISQVPENELIFASKFYKSNLQGAATEAAYYQTLGRMCNSGELCRISKGTYYRPKVGRFGVIPPSQKEIVSAFTKLETGTVVGYSLYNDLRLTTQVSKTIEVLSSQIDQQTKNISNVLLQYCNLTYSPDVSGTIHMMEVLQNFDSIQDLNYASFLRYAKKFAESYRDETFATVIREKRYQKKTISFLKEVLTYYGVANNLGTYLSQLSEYKHPSMEEIYEAAYKT